MDGKQLHDIIANHDIDSQIQLNLWGELMEALGLPIEVDWTEVE